VELRASQIEDDLFRVTLIIRNLTSMGSADREHVLLRSLISVHNILHCEGGEFVSLLDPPEQCGSPVSKVLQGREMEVVALEIEEAEALQ
jgi:hypothetical protein